MTPLEALDKINTMFLAYAPRDIREDKELNEDLFGCIKSVIEENKILKNINHELVREKECLYLENILNEEARTYLYKKLEALEIIKENIHFETQVIKGEETLVVEKLFFVKMPKEKRDLLKEVLL